jgi:hypothetical protein
VNTEGILHALPRHASITVMKDATPLLERKSIEATVRPHQLAKLLVVIRAFASVMLTITTQDNQKSLLRNVVAEIVLLATYITAYQQQQEDKGAQMIFNYCGGMDDGQLLYGALSGVIDHLMGFLAHTQLLEQTLGG